MAQIIPASQLVVGDLYRNVSFGTELRGQVYKVEAIRTVRSVDTYQVVEATNLATGNRAGINVNLRHDIDVARLTPMDFTDVADMVTRLGEGRQLHVTRHNDQFWV